MTLAEYKEKYLNTDETDFEITKELAEAWLMEKTNAVKQIAQIEKDVNYNLVGGAYDEISGDFEHSILICGMWGDLNLHIYDNIDFLAEILGIELKRQHHNETYDYEYYFMFNGVRVFAISNILYKNSVETP